MLDLSRISAGTVNLRPFRSVIASDVLLPSALPDLARDYPSIRQAGFFPVEQLSYGQAFDALVEELRSDDLARLLGNLLGCDLVGRPQLITVREWSAPKDGRVHTDGSDKIASALLYLNPTWPYSEGRLRLLPGPDLDSAEAIEISASFGQFVAFQRSESSWHGHLPYKGRRRVVQLAWLRSEEAMARKLSRHRRSGFLKSLFGPSGVAGNGRS